MASKVLLSQARSKHAPLPEALLAHLLRPLKCPPPPVKALSTAPTIALSSDAPATAPNAISQIHSTAPPCASAPSAFVPFSSVSKARSSHLHFASRHTAPAISPAVSPFFPCAQSPSAVHLGGEAPSASARAIPVVSWANILPPAAAVATAIPSPTAVVLPLPLLSRTAFTSRRAAEGRDDIIVRRRLVVAPAASAVTAAAAMSSEQVLLPQGIQTLLEGLTKRKDTEGVVPAKGLCTPVVMAAPSNPSADPSTPTTGFTITARTFTEISSDSPHPTLLMLPDDFPLTTSPLASPTAHSLLFATTEQTSARTPTSSSSPTRATSTTAAPHVTFTIGSPVSDSPPLNHSPTRKGVVPTSSSLHHALPHPSALHSHEKHLPPCRSAAKQATARSATAGLRVYHHPHFPESRSKAKPSAGGSGRSGGKRMTGNFMDLRYSSATKPAATASQPIYATSKPVKIAIIGQTVRSASSSDGADSGSTSAGPRMPDGTRGFTMGRGRCMDV